MSHPDDRSGNLPSPSDKKTLQDELREVMADKSLTDDERIVRLCCHGWSGNMLALLAAPSHVEPYLHPKLAGARDSEAYRQEKAALEAADALRYRWLRDKSLCQWEHPICVEQKMGVQVMQYIGPLVGEPLDRAIDKAMTSTGPQHSLQEKK